LLLALLDLQDRLVQQDHLAVLLVQQALMAQREVQALLARQVQLALLALRVQLVLLVLRGHKVFKEILVLLDRKVFKVFKACRASKA
jgi:hypothetical protein